MTFSFHQSLRGQSPCSPTQFLCGRDETIEGHAGKLSCLVLVQKDGRGPDHSPLSWKDLGDALGCYSRENLWPSSALYVPEDTRLSLIYA